MEGVQIVGRQQLLLDRQPLQKPNDASSFSSRKDSPFRGDVLEPVRAQETERKHCESVTACHPPSCGHGRLLPMVWLQLITDRCISSTNGRGSNCMDAICHVCGTKKAWSLTSNQEYKLRLHVEPPEGTWAAGQ